MKMLDDKGRCCGRKPIKYKRDPHYFCMRCDRSYDVYNFEQVENWAWRWVNGRFQPRSKTEYNCNFCKDTGMVAIRSQDGTYAFPGSVPDDAKGYADADCWYCDCARTPRG